jgi:hypothetical protein
MNDNNDYFKKALSDFAFDAAYGDSIRHLYRKGYSPEAIKKHLNCESLSIERISSVIDRFKDSMVDGNSSDEKKSSGQLQKSLDKSPDSPVGQPTNSTCRYEYVKEYDSYGRASFIKRKIPD